jgi:hypothetical protein
MGNGNGNGSEGEAWMHVIIAELLALDNEKARERRINELAEERYWEVYNDTLTKDLAVMAKNLAENHAREYAYGRRSERWKVLWAKLTEALRVKQEIQKEVVAV